MKNTTKDECINDALNYKSRSEFNKNSPKLYRCSLKNDWIDEVCSHMKPIGDLYKRCIYVYEFSDNCAYIGLTFNIDKRHKEHLKRGTVCDHLKNNNYILKQLTEYIGVEIAKLKESEYVKEYKKNGWNILNKAKTGSVGAILLWTKEKCQIESLKYSYRFDFQKGSRSAYLSASLNGWLDEICSHMKNKKYIWTEKENCKKEALKYKTRVDFRRKSSSAYDSSLKNKWLDEICSHMESKWKRNYWTYDECKKEALKYSNRNSFSIHSPYVCKLSRKMGWLDKFFPK